MNLQEKRYISYNQIHELVRHTVQERKVFENFKPSLILAIGAGGFIPARILRTFLKRELGRNVPILAIGLTLYEDPDGGDPLVIPVRKTQWIASDPVDSPTAVDLSGQNILIVDEVDDSRKTLEYAVAELEKDVARQRAHHHSSTESSTWRDPEIGVFVVHNKIKEKRGALPTELMASRYISCQDVSDTWNVYPWDAIDSFEHTYIAEQGALADKRHPLREKVNVAIA